jgi:hypothetical protein
MLFERFLLGNYIESVKEILKTHDNLFFHEEKTERYVILRHDVDYSLEDALGMAREEEKNGIRSTYFVLLNSDLYNIMDGSYVAGLMELGHCIGLHYDLAKDGDIVKQLKLLELLCGKEIPVIAAHNPSRAIKDEWKTGGFIRSAYADEFTKDIVYWSDSCMAWRDDAWEAWQTGTIPNKFQLLTHAENWPNTLQNREEIFNNLAYFKKRKLEAYFSWARGLCAVHPGVRQEEERTRLHNKKAVAFNLRNARHAVEVWERLEETLGK